MNCAACGAPRNGEHTYCAVCGRADDDKGSQRWDRAPEAMLYEHLQPLLKENESLMSATRGRIGGSWRSRINFSPFAFMAPYANLGLTPDRIVIQQVHPKTGEGVANAANEIPLVEVASIDASDADPFAPGHTVRLTVLRNDGESFRVKAVGRLAEAATEMAEVWRTLSESSNGKQALEERCEACGHALGRAFRYCPFCGGEQGA